MPRGGPPEWRRLKPPVLDDYIAASINAAGGVCDETTGHFAVLHYVGCADLDRAKEIVRALHRAANRQKVSMSATVHPADDGTFYVKFKAISKAHARAYVLAKYGPDRSQWPYDPRRKGSE